MQSFKWPHPATVIALVALFVALAGTSYAALALPRGSVTSYHVRDRSLLASDFRQGQLSSLPATLPSGRSLSGTYFVGGGSATGNVLAAGHISFALRLRSAPVAHFVRQGESAPSACPGSVFAPAAARGHLCIYEGGYSQASVRDVRDPAAIGSFRNPAAVDTGARVRPYGAGIVVLASAGGTFYSAGTWAVRAP